MTDEEKGKFWQEHIQAYRSSKLSAKAWCEQNNIKVHMLRKWITTFNKESKNSFTSKKWLPIEVSSETKETTRQTTSSGIRINIGDLSIEISSEFNSQTLETVVGILSKNAK